jgi:hypothetical protein
MIRTLLASLAAVAVLATAVASPSYAAEDTTWDGLQKVKSKRMDQAYLLPGADFREYTRVMLDNVEVDFRKNWERDINRSRSPGARVTAEDADRIRQTMAQGLRERLAKDFAKAGYPIVTEPGPDVLRLTPVLVDVYVNAPDTTMQAGRSRTYTVEAGEATLALEARDSETGQLLGRAVDRRGTGDAGRLTWTTEAYNRAEFDRLFDTWGTILTRGLEALKEASPIQPKQK